MKTLILTRHAKSSWDNPLLGDHQRVLNDRGRKNATAMAEWLRVVGHVPDAVLCSTAERCVQTWEQIELKLRSGAELNYESGLYHSAADQIIAYLRKAHAGTVQLIAHNPGIGDAAMRLAKTPAAHDAFFRYPTCATTIYTFNINAWSDLQFGQGKIDYFQIPRELP